MGIVSKDMNMDSWSSVSGTTETARIEFITPIADDRRRSPREEARDLSSLTLNVNDRPVTCLVHNISETGAMIETSVRDLPARFILDNPTKKLRVLCRVVWSCKGLTGVEFIKMDT